MKSQISSTTQPPAARAPLLVGAILMMLLLPSLLLPAAAVAGPASKRHTPAEIVASVVHTRMTEGLMAWPSSPGDAVTLDAASIRAQFDLVNYPNPPAELAPFASALVCDNLTPIDPNVTWDSNGDGKLVLEWRAASAGSVCHYTVVMQRMFRNYLSPIPSGLALFTGGDLVSKGGGTNPKIGIEVEPVTGGPTTVMVAGTVNDPTVVGYGITLQTGASVGTFDDLVGPAWVDLMRSSAQATGRYFTSAAAALASPVDARFSPQGGISGLCVLDLPNGSTLTMPSGTWNSPSSPGLLLVLCPGGAATLEVAGSGDYYGIACVQGALATAHGDLAMHGEVLAAGSADLGSTHLFLYNDTVATLARTTIRVTVEVNEIPGTLVRLE